MYRSIIALMAGVTLTWLACGPKPATNEPARTTEPTGDPRSAERPADTRSRPESGSTVEITAAAVVLLFAGLISLFTFGCSENAQEVVAPPVEPEYGCRT